MSEPKWVNVLCPTKPHDLPKELRNGITHIAEQVAAAAVIHNRGKDLLLLVYMAGIYHGVKLGGEGESNDPGGESAASIPSNERNG